MPAHVIATVKTSWSALHAGSWTTYAREHNLKPVRTSLGELGPTFPAPAMKQLGTYPQQATRCVAPGKQSSK